MIKHLMIVVMFIQLFATIISYFDLLLFMQLSVLNLIFTIVLLTLGVYDE